MCTSGTGRHPVDQYQYKGRFEVRFARFHLYEPFSRPALLDSSWEAGLLQVTPGRISCMVGASVKSVELMVDIRQEPPDAVRDDYEDIVEVSYESTYGELGIFSWPERLVHELPPLSKGAGSYRLRYHMRNMEGGSDSDTSIMNIPGECLLQIWPAPEDEVRELKVTSATGKFWHPAEMLRAPLIEAGLISPSIDDETRRGGAEWSGGPVPT